MTTQTRRHLALRIRPDALAAIDQLTDKHGLSRTDYMVRASTGELHDVIALDARFGAVEDRLARLEHMAGLGAFD